MSEKDIEDLIREALEAEMKSLPTQHYQRTPECLKTWRLDAGIQTGWTAAERQHLDSKCPYCLKMVAFAGENPPKEIGALADRRPSPRSIAGDASVLEPPLLPERVTPWWRNWWWAPALAAVACAVIVVVILLSRTNGPRVPGAGERVEIADAPGIPVGPSIQVAPKVEVAPPPQSKNLESPPSVEPEFTPSHVSGSELSLRFEGAGETRSLSKGSSSSDPILRIQTGNPALRIVMQIPSEDLRNVRVSCLLQLEVGGREIRTQQIMPVQSGKAEVEVGWSIETAGLAQEDYLFTVSGCTTEPIQRQFRLLRGAE